MASSSPSTTKPNIRRFNNKSLAFNDVPFFSKLLPIPMLLLLLLVGSSFVSWSSTAQNKSNRSSNISILLASAFAPKSITQSSSHAPTTLGGIIFNTRKEDATAVLFAKKKNGGKKVPKMPTLPVSKSPTPTSEESSASVDTTTTTSNEFYSTSTNNPPPLTSNQISTMVVMDVENIRGATSFRISHEALLSRIRLWRDDRLSMEGGEGGQKSTSSAFLEPLIWVCDHGRGPSIHHFSLFSKNDNPGDADDASAIGKKGSNDIQMPHNFGAIFAGPGRPADDVIVDLVESRCGGGVNTIVVGNNDDDIPSTSDESQFMDSSSSRNNTIVITADAKLISRCQQARRKSSSLSDVIFVEPTSLLQQLERYRINAIEEESLFGMSAAPLTRTPPIRSGSNNKAMLDDGGGKRADGKTSTMTSFKDSTIAMQQHAKFQARFQNKNGGDDTLTEPASNEEVEEEEENSPSAAVDTTNDSSKSAALAAQLKTEQIRRQLLLSDAYYLARPSKNVRGRRSITASAAVHAKYKNRNISKKQQKKLFAKRFGKKRKEDMAQAAMKRKELALKLQLNLERAASSSGGGSADTTLGGEILIRSVHLLDELLAKFEEERLMKSKSSTSLSNINSDDSNNGNLSTLSSDPTSILGLDSSVVSGRIGSDDKWDPLGSTLIVPLRKDVQEKTDKSSSLPPLRVVVISDTHGFEGALSRFADPGTTTSSKENDEEGGGGGDQYHHPKLIHSDDFLLPQADVLLHCGDFAASGSRKTQRAAARRLDDFLARQTHIPEKIVVQGNHDPDSPAKVLFPSSKALYVRSSSTLMVNGVSFTLEPFSRRMAFRSIRRRTTSSDGVSSSLPKCDIFVSHEPPKGVLDLTYHGFSAGSLYLRELVEHAEHKPRLWLCGHIHESRGVMTKHFQPADGQSGDDEESKDASTMIINASNANSGRANRLVSGAVLVEVERHQSSSITEGGDETAESTLQSQKVDFDGFADSDSADALSGLGQDLEVYVTRPGVRRRKGVPRSVRQQMKNVRTTLVASESNED